MFCDVALQFDPLAMRCDVAFDGRDLVLDATLATPLLVSIGSDRRARADDDLPDTASEDDAPSRLNVRRGWCGDALDRMGRLIGSRLWLLRRRKQDEPTRRLAEGAAAEALAWFETERGLPVQVTVRWVARGVLGIWARVGTFAFQVNQIVASPPPGGTGG